jgi:hypothetical protein
MGNKWRQLRIRNVKSVGGAKRALIFGKFELVVSIFSIFAFNRVRVAFKLLISLYFFLRVLVGNCSYVHPPVVRARSCRCLTLYFREWPIV